MTDAEVFDGLRQIIVEALQRPDLAVTRETTARQVPGWDSFKMVEIVVAVEERYGVTIETEDLEALRNVGDLARRIADKLRAR